MNNGSDIEVRVTANLGELERGMDQAARSVENGAQRMDGSLKEAGDSMSGVAELVRSRLAMVAGIAAAAFASIGLKSAAEDAAKFTESSMDLGRAMGVSASQASVWSAVLDDVGASQEELAAASRGLTTKLRDNEEGLNRMGLVTRDANGKLRNMNDLMHDAIAVVNSYREGTDRNAAAQEVFGRAVSGSSKLLMVSAEKAEEIKQKMEELGIVVGQEDVEAWKKYDDASDNADLTMKAVRDTIGRALIPVLTAFKEKIVAVGPELVKIARVAMETLLGVVDLARMVKQAFVSVGSDIGAVAAAAALALRGDFTGAMNVFRERAADAIKETQRLKDLWNGTGDSFLGKFRQKWEASATPDQGGSDYEAPPSSGGGSRKARGTKTDGPIDVFDNGSFITDQKLVADFIRKQYDAVNDLQREIARDAERAAKETEDALKRQAEIEKKKIDAQTDFINGIEEEAVLSGMSNDERETALMLIEAEKLGIKDVNHLLELQAQIRENNNAKQAAEELKRQQDAIYESVQEGVQRAFADGLNAVASGDGGIRGALKGIVDTIRNALSNAIAGSLADQFLGMLGGKQGVLSIAGSLGLGGQRGDSASNPVYTKESGLSASSANPENTNSLFSGVVDTIRNMFEKIAIAIKAVFSSIRGASSGSGLGGVVGLFGSLFGGSIPSAAGGYDVPAGANPITRLHEREMVLPAKHADVVRSMAEGSVANMAPPEVRVNNINVLDREEVAGIVGKTREFERSVLNVIQLNPSILR